MKKNYLFTGTSASVAGLLITLQIGGCTTFDEISKPAEVEYVKDVKKYMEGREQFDETHEALGLRLAGVDAAAGEQFHDDVQSSGLATEQQMDVLFPHDAVPFKSELVRTSLGELSVTLQAAISPQYLFAPAVYRIVQTDAAGKALVAWVASVLKEIDSVLSEAAYDSGSSEVEATFVGSADSAPIGPSKVFYGGEFGRVVMPYESTTLNGKARRFDIWPRQSLGNNELAALRAASLAAMVSVLVVPRSWSVAYEIETAAERGHRYRYAQVKLRLRAEAKATNLASSL